MCVAHSVPEPRSVPGAGKAEKRKTRRVPRAAGEWSSKPSCVLRKHTQQARLGLFRRDSGSSQTRGGGLAVQFSEASLWGHLCPSPPNLWDPRVLHTPHETYRLIQQQRKHFLVCGFGYLILSVNVLVSSLETRQRKTFPSRHGSPRATTYNGPLFPFLISARHL